MSHAVNPPYRYTHAVIPLSPDDLTSRTETNPLQRRRTLLRETPHNARRNAIAFTTEQANRIADAIFARHLQGTSRA